MQCFHCDAKLEKSDIFCHRCQTPVLTEDDAALVNFQFTNQTDDDLFDTGTAKYIRSDTGSKTSGFTDFDNVAGLNSSKNNIAGQRANIPVKNIREHFDFEKADFHGDSNNKVPNKNRRKKQNNNRLPVILITLLICIAITGVGLFLLIRPSGDSQSGSRPSGSGTEDGSVQNGEQSTIDQPPESDLTVSSILVLSAGRAQTEFHAGVGEIVTLQARVQPAWLEEDITWTSSDPEVLEVRQISEDGSEAEIMGLIPGVADIILTAGDFEINYIVYVDNLPLHVQLENAIDVAGTSIWLTILWQTGPDADYETLFKRDTDTNLWIMESVSGSADVNPTFISVTNALTFSLPTSDKVYYLYSDNTGFYGTLNEPDNDTFIWWFITIPTEGEG